MQELSPLLILQNSLTLADAEVGLMAYGWCRAKAWGAWDAYTGRPLSLAGLVGADARKNGVLAEREKRAEVDYSLGWQFGVDRRGKA